MTARDDLLDTYGRAETAPLGTWTDLHQALAEIRAEVLREAADRLALELAPDGPTLAGYPLAVTSSVRFLRRMADEAGTS